MVRARAESHPDPVERTSPPAESAPVVVLEPHAECTLRVRVLRVRPLDVDLQVAGEVLTVLRARIERELGIGGLRD